MTTAEAAAAAPADPHGLSELERRFVHAFYGPARLCATKAAELAGYRATSRQALRGTAHRLLHRYRVCIALAAAEPAWTAAMLAVVKADEAARRAQRRAARS